MYKHLKIVSLSIVISLGGFSSLSRAIELNVEVDAFKQRSTDGLVIELLGPGVAAALPAEFEINLIDKEFIPLLTIAGVGSILSFNNQDQLKHHAYSVSTGNKFELPLHNGRSETIIQLDTPGIVKLGCNIHDWMLAYVYVAESNRVKIMDTRSVVTFSNLSAGDYEIRVWGPRLRNTKKTVTASVTLVEGQTQTKKIKIKLRKRIRKPRRNDQAQGYD